MPSETRKKPVVLMVDDDLDFQRIMRGWLSERYEMIGASNGDEMKDELDIALPDALILDVNLPGPDGFRLCDRLRSDERFARLPILFLTAGSGKEFFLKNLEVGGSAFLSKPIERVELLTELGRLLGEF